MTSYSMNNINDNEGHDMMNTANELQVRPSCPCKRIPLSWSSFTAAEYGDCDRLETLYASKKTSSNASSRIENISGMNPGGTTPLHLAAQHGHVSAILFLLQEQPSVSSESGQGFATPLHRASFSGAVGTMRVLLDHATKNGRDREELLARDFSFGDGRSPLHKAAAGGRYLAVLLLLRALKERGLLSMGLQQVDAQGRTPAQVACFEEEQVIAGNASVQRWDVVAGGPANWQQCIILLEHAALRVNRPVRPNKDPSQTAAMSRSNVLSSSDTHLPPCLDCSNENGTPCVTATWEAAFRQALQQSIETDSIATTTVPVQAITKEEMSTSNASPSSLIASVDRVGIPINAAHTNTDLSLSDNIPNASDTESLDVPLHQISTTNGHAWGSGASGTCCSVCHTPGFAFFRGRSGQLLCNKCKRA
jgi:ankyrin repeat protein